jgi:hypothetical protein
MRSTHSRSAWRSVAAFAVLVDIAAGTRAVPARAEDSDEAAAPVAVSAVADSPDLDVVETRATQLEDLDLLVFEQLLKGGAGKTSPRARGGLNGAPVLAYVFPTTLSPGDVGFGTSSGTLALLATAHPDFDDTPLWDENGDGRYDNDGAVWHAHWAVLVPDKALGGQLRVKDLDQATGKSALPPTAPDMPLYLDSPGFPVVTQGDSLKILVPASRVGRRLAFNFDALTAYLQISTAPGTPMLGVYKVYDVLSGDMKLPYTVKRR